MPGPIDQPPIETDRLLLRAFSPRDAPDVQRLAGRREVAETTLHIPHPYRDGMAENWIATHAQGRADGSAITFAVTRKDSGLLLGAVSLTGIEKHGGELGYWIARPYWGKGYCTEAASALIAYVSRGLGIERVRAEHLSSNPASGRVLQKLGMHHVASKRKPDRRGVMADIEVWETP
jgi:RimJ/RimL family protein N-acetyltransferase